jgi:hypothetical protein
LAAAVLESNPNVPAPSYADVYAFPPDSECDMMRAEVDAVAGLLGGQGRCSDEEMLTGILQHRIERWLELKAPSPSSGSATWR